MSIARASAGPDRLHRSFVRSAAAFAVLRMLPAAGGLAGIILISHTQPPAVYGTYAGLIVRLAVICGIGAAGLPVLVLSHTLSELRSAWKRAPAMLRWGAVAWILLLAVAGAALLRPLSPVVAATLSVCGAAIPVLEAVGSAVRRYRPMVGITALAVVGGLVAHRLAMARGFQVQWLFTALAGIVLLRSAALAIVAVAAWKGAEGVGSARAVSARFWLQSAAYDASQILLRNADKFILSFLLSKAIAAQYFNGAIEIPFVGVLVGAAGGALLADRAGSKQPEGRDSAEGARLVGRLLSAVVYPLFFLLFLFGEEVVRVVFSDAYVAAVPIFSVAVWILPLRAYHHTALLQSRHRGADVNRGALLDAAVALLVVYPFYYWMGLPGVALAPVVSTAVQSAYYLLRTGAVYGVPAAQLLPLRAWIARALLCGGVVGTLACGLPGGWSPAHRLLYAGIAAALLGAGFMLYELLHLRTEAP